MHPLPLSIRKFAERHLPLTRPFQEFRWLRTRVQAVDICERPEMVTDILLPRKPPIPQDTRVVLADVDQDRFYEVRIEGAGHDIAVMDAVSLIGHAPVGVKAFTPRLLLNHSTNTYNRAYPDIMNQLCLIHGTNLSVLQHQYWLSVVTVSTPWNKVVDVLDKAYNWFLSPMTPWKIRARNILAVALFLAASGFNPFGHGSDGQMNDPIMGWMILNTDLLFIASPALAVAGGMAFQFVRRLYGMRHMQPTFKYQASYNFLQLTGIQNTLDRWFKVRTDRTYLYEEVAEKLHRWVLNNPDESFSVESVR